MRTRILAALAVCSALFLAGTRIEAQKPGASVLKTTLKNQMQVVIVPDPLAPVVTTVMNYKAGSDEAPPNFPGMAHAQEHMMFRGSQGLDANQLAAVGAALGGNFNADTQQMITQYIFTVPSSDLDTVLHIEAIRMQGVLDTQALWNEERGAIEQEVQRDFSSPTYVFYTKLLPILFRDSPYSHDALGTVASFNQTTGEMLQKFHKEWYAPNNAVLVITGDVDPQAALRSVQQLFDPIPARQLPPKPAFQFQPVAAQTIRQNTDQPYGLAVLAFRTPGLESTDYAALQVMSDALNDERSSLSELAVQGKALQAGFSLEMLPKAGVGLAIAAFPASANGDQELQILKSTVAADLKNGLQADLVQAAQRRALLDSGMRKTSVEGLAMDWSEAIGIEGRQSPEEDTAAMQKVTVSDVDRVARKYLDFDHAVAAVLTPKPSGSGASGEPGPQAGTPESFTPSNAKPVPLPEWAQKAIDRLAVPKSDVNPVSSSLKNGLRVIVQPENVSNTISVFGHIRNSPELEAPKGQDGVASVLSDLFPYGTTTLDRNAFQKALDEIGASETAGTDFSLQVLSSNFDRGMQLLADNELHPALREADFKIVQQQEAGVAGGTLKSPGYQASHALEAGLFPANDPTLREMTPQTVGSLKLTDVSSYHQKVYRPDLTTIVVIGNVTADQARTIVDKYFGSWTANGPKPATDLPSVPANKAYTGGVRNPLRVQDQVTMAQAMELTRFDPDYYALEMGNTILGGAFYATRLYRDLRENTGLVYTVSSNLQAGHNRSVYEVSFGCNPSNTARAADIVRKDLNAMRTAPADDKEMHQARALLLSGIPLGEASEASIARGFLSRTDVGLPLDEPTRAAQRYMNLKASEIQAAFSKWIRPDALAEEVEGPAGKK